MAALLGVGVVEKLNQVKVRLNRGAKIPLIIAGIILGGVLGFGFRFLFTRDLIAISLASVPFMICMAILILAVFLRLRTT